MSFQADRALFVVFDSDPRILGLHHLQFMVRKVVNGLSFIDLGRPVLDGFAIEGQPRIDLKPVGCLL